MHTISIEDDSEMLEFFKIVDILSAFESLHTNWLKMNNANWHSKEISASLSKVFNYVDQLASYVSVSHEHVEIVLDYDIDSLSGKQFATVIKRTDEWKTLRKWLRTEHQFNQQNVTVKAICECIIAETRQFIDKIK
jgi:hypothetical protein